MEKASKTKLHKPKIIGYLRVSTLSQELEKNKADILAMANTFDLGKVSFVEEVISGKVSWRKRKIAEVLEELRADDSIIVSEMSRLGRSRLECMEILSGRLQKGVHIYAVKGNWKLDNSIENHRDGVFDGCRDRARFNFF